MIKLGNESIEKSLVVWLNSTFTIVYLRSLFTTVEEEFGYIYRWHIGTIPVPDLTNQKIVDKLMEVFEQFNNVAWNSLPEQYKEAIKEDDSIRLKFDLAVVKALANY